MAFGYRDLCRDQPFLLPPDMREWLPKDHLVWFLLDVIDVLDTSVLHGRSKRGGVGRAVGCHSDLGRSLVDWRES